MAVGFSNTNKPLNPRGNDQSPLAYNRAKLFSGKALDFDGVNDYVQADSVNETLDNYTLSWNLKTSSTQNYSSIFSNSTNVIDIYVKSNGQLRFYTDQGYDSTNLPPLNDGQWKNFVLSISGTSLNIYVNGVLSETLAITDVSRSIANIRLGYIFANLYAFNGEMSGFKIFNTALTAAQVADLYNNPEKVVPTGVDNTALKLWLPMQEGAGTTAYDGSGNGNHGTISGATYVHGIGAPVSQTAVIDWNKGVNLTPNSEDWGLWVLNFVSVTTNDTTAPDGQTTADKIIVDSNNNFHRIYRQSYPNTTTNDLAFSVYLKYNDHQHVSFGLTDDSSYRSQFVVDLIGGTITYEQTDNTNVVSSSLTDVGNGWYKLEGVITPTTAWVNNIYTMLMFQNSSTFSSSAFTNAGASVYAWGAQSEFASNNGPYVPTFATNQPNDVLLPQGLTTGRDITGVNLFENVRKQGALNLDGNSWAEVHDNASLDITSAITLEAWVYAGSGTDNGVLGKWYYTTNKRSYIIYQAGTNSFRFYTSSNGTNDTYAAATISNGWNHLVGVDDGTNLKFYVNGSEEASVSSLGSIYASDQNLKIGNMLTSSQSFPAPIAQPRIYNRALTAEEVQRNYNAGKNTYTN